MNRGGARLVFVFGFSSAAGVIGACVGDEPTPVNIVNDAGGGGPLDGPASNDAPSGGDDGGGGDAGCTGSQQLCGGHCVDVTKESAHCGRCDHDCQGGECTSGTCQPVTLTTATSPLLNASRIATDGTSVCWTVRSSSGKVFCVPAKLAGAPATPVTVYSGSDPLPVTVLAGTVYWLGPDAVAAANLTLFKGTPTVAGSSAVVRSWTPAAPANFFDGWELTGNAAGSEVYVGRETTRNDGTFDAEILSVKTDGTSYTNLLSVNGANPVDTRPHGIDFDGVATYAVYGGSAGGVVWRHALGGGGTTSTLSTTEVAPTQISVEANYAYWADGNDPPRIRRSPVTASTPTDVVRGTSNIIGMVVAGGNVYFTQLGDSAVYVAPVTGAAAATKYVAGAAGVDEPGYLARDAKAIYWVDKSTGAVRKVALR